MLSADHWGILHKVYAILRDPVHGTEYGPAWGVYVCPDWDLATPNVDNVIVKYIPVSGEVIGVLL
jgi:hypothetical protein